MNHTHRCLPVLTNKHVVDWNHVWIFPLTETLAVRWNSPARGVLWRPKMNASYALLILGKIDIIWEFRKQMPKVYCGISYLFRDPVTASRGRVSGVLTKLYFLLYVDASGRWVVRASHDWLSLGVFLGLARGRLLPRRPPSNEATSCVEKLRTVRCRLFGYRRTIRCQRSLLRDDSCWCNKRSLLASHAFFIQRTIPRWTYAQKHDHEFHSTCCCHNKRCTYVKLWTTLLRKLIRTWILMNPKERSYCKPLRDSL